MSSSTTAAHIGFQLGFSGWLSPADASRKVNTWVDNPQSSNVANKAGWALAACLDDLTVNFRNGIVGIPVHAMHDAIEQFLVCSEKFCALEDEFS